VRVDSGVRAGDTVSTHYDPMIAKLIAHGPDRETAFRTLATALAESELAGTVCNLDFLGALCRNEDVLAGRLDTDLIARHSTALTQLDGCAGEALAVAAVVALGLDTPVEQEGFRLWGHGQHRCRIVHDGEPVECVVSVQAAGEFVVQCGDNDPVPVRRSDDELTLSNPTRRVRAVEFGRDITVFHSGHHRFERVDAERSQADEQQGGDVVLAPMPGLLRVLDVAVGESVTAGQTLAVMEAMKMEHALVAPRDGTVGRLGAAAGRASRAVTAWSTRP